ncbi:MAG: SusC/RagA family TonB-linked outer membrane protein [Tannerella sp.]|nr:SusC/RagA family TonB-linked outer membrane protein [Tannerella sp.]
MYANFTQKRKAIVLIFGMMVCWTWGNAQTSNTQATNAQIPNDKKITASFREESLAKALVRVERLSDYKMNFNYEELDRYKVTVEIKDKTAPEAVDALLKGLPLEKSVNGKYIAVRRSRQMRDAATTQQSDNQREISGVVITSDREPLMGVNIREAGSTVGVITGIDGRFSIKTSNNEKLVFSYIGFETVEMKAKNGMIVTMNEDVALLGDVVVTGYQVISKERAAGAYSIVRGSEVKESAQARGSILESLEGMTAGFTVNMSNDAVSKYLVRGLTSINSSQEPLFVLDGVPLSGADMEALITANEVASITVLKDATAVSIWGSRAANGVVVIVTRNGSNTNGRVNLAYDGNITFKGKVDLDYFNLMNSATFIKNARERFEAADYQSSYPIGDMETNRLLWSSAYAQVLYPHEGPLYAHLKGDISADERDRQLALLSGLNGYKSYQDEFMTNPWMQNHTVTLSGGTDKLSVIGSIGYEGRTGDYHNTDDTYKLNFKQNFKLFKWLNWDLIINAAYTDNKSYVNPLAYYNTNLAIKNLLPYTVLQNDGIKTNFNTLYFSPEQIADKSLTYGIGTDFYPVEDFFNSTVKTNSMKIRANTGLKIDLPAGLGYEVRFSYLRSSANTEQYIPQETWAIRSACLNAVTPDKEQLLPNKGGDYTVTDGFDYDRTLRNQLTFNCNFNDFKHQITALAGMEHRESKTRGYSMFERGYDYQTMTQTYYDITAVRNFKTANIWGEIPYVEYDNMRQTEIVLRYVSYYANVAYTFNRKYSINGNIRIDQSNLFGTDVNNQYKPIGSAGLAWNIKNEDFMKNLATVSALTLRLGYGHSGNSPLPDAGGPYNIIEPYTSGITNVSGYRLSTPANRKLSWEKTRTWNVGLDFAFLKHRLNGTLDIYNKRTTNLLGNQSLNGITGFKSVYANVGELLNKGFEISLKSHNIATPYFNWYTSLMLSYNKNEVVDYYLEPTTSAGTMLTRHYVEGYPAGALFALKWAGLRHEDGAAQAYDKDGKPQADYNLLTADDTHYAGTIIPKWTGTLVNKLNYRNFDLSFMFVFNAGHHLRTAPYMPFDGRFLTNRLNDYDLRWRQPGDEANTDVPSAYDDISNTGRSRLRGTDIYIYGDNLVQSAAFVKLRELAVGYSLPRAACSILHAQSLRFRIAGHNLWRWVANDKNIDPEAFSLYTGDRATQYGAYFSIGLSANF